MRYASRCIADEMIHWRYIAMRCDTIHPYYDAVWFDWLIGKNRYTTNNKLTCIFWLLTPRSFHKTRLPNRPGLFHLVWLTVKWFGSIKKILQRSTSVTHVYLCWKANLVQGRQTVRLSWAPLTLTNRNTILPLTLSHTIIACSLSLWFYNSYTFYS